MHKNNCFSVYISRAVIGGHFDTKIIVIDQADQKLWGDGCDRRAAAAR